MRDGRLTLNSQKSSPLGSGMAVSESNTVVPFALTAEPSLLQSGHADPPRVPRLIGWPPYQIKAVCATTSFWPGVLAPPATTPEVAYGIGKTVGSAQRTDVRDSVAGRLRTLC